MCWSLAASASMVAVGTVATAVSLRRRQPAIVPGIIAYFTMMEALQAVGYLYAGSCGSSANRAITLLSYLHIVFQPFVINAFAMHLVPAGVSQRLQRGVYAVCGLSAVFMLVQLVPLEWAGQCRLGQALCGLELCLRPGDWHIAWDIPYNGLSRPLEDALGTNFGFPTYAIAVFAMPLLYGAWRLAVFNALIGPGLSTYLTTNPNEAPAIWCLFSIGVILVAMTPAFMAQFRVERWPLWPRTWTAGPKL